jgi:hypothetical protein
MERKRERRGILDRNSEIPKISTHWLVPTAKERGDRRRKEAK